ncbi:MAG TPA: ADYC domain-containing protein [Kofleriaceae bacterium]
MRSIRWLGVLLLSACAEPELGRVQQAYMSQQGTQLHGIQLQGTQAAGMTLQGFQLEGATLNGAALVNLRVEHGELVAEQGQVTYHGADLVNAQVYAQVRNLFAIPPTTATLEYRITAIEAESPDYDPTHTGSTFLYTLEQNVDDTGSWQPACAIDGDGHHAAIPLTATWNGHGDRVESSSLFTFSCTTGVIAKCYRWGYRPWVTGYGDLTTLHWTCTRMARADYCGNGTSHTRDGTVINFWDNAPAPGPIRTQGTTPLGMLFEAGWSTSGAVCLSHARWLLSGPVIALGCPDRLIAPGLGILGATVCDTAAQVLGQATSARMFDESNLNLNLDLF